MTTHNYETDLAKKADAEASQRLSDANRAVWDELLARFPLADHEANFNLFVEYCNPLTIAGGEHLLRAKPQGFTVAMTTREDLINELVELRRENTSRKTLSDHDLNSWRIRVSVWSLRQLRDYKRKIVFEHAHKTAESAREYLAGVRKEEPNSFPGWPRLPQRMILPHGKIEYTNIDSNFLKQLARDDYYAFKHRFVGIYGADQITARMNNEA
jgi:hypothetical protein